MRFYVGEGLRTSAEVAISHRTRAAQGRPAVRAQATGNCIRIVRSDQRFTVPSQGVGGPV